MKVELEMWHLISLFVSFMGCCWLFGTQLVRQFEMRLDDRFRLQEEHRQERDGQREMQRREDAAEQSAALRVLDVGQRALERDLLEFKAQLPEVYVRRDDHIRSQTVIEAKLDAVAARLSEFSALVGRHE